MILSVSRRTDIPAFYSEWFFNRLEEGYVLVRNPMNHNQVSRISLSPSVIDCIVFWTKDPGNMLGKLGLLSRYKYYFQITVTGYGNDIEPNVRSKECIINAFRSLSSRIGKEKTIWRYDPIILTDKIDVEYHSDQFGFLASQLNGYTDLCIISFVDFYRKTERDMKGLNVRVFNDEKMLEIGKRLSDIAKTCNMRMATCSELVDLSSVRISHAKCIDDRLISRIIGQDISIEKDKNQRDSCGCVTSVDIGVYNTCRHSCLYCYANYSEKVVKDTALKHDPNSPFLIGKEEPGDRITERKMRSYIDGQLSFDAFTK